MTKIILSLMMIVSITVGASNGIEMQKISKIEKLKEGNSFKVIKLVDYQKQKEEEARLKELKKVNKALDEKSASSTFFSDADAKEKKVIIKKEVFAITTAQKYKNSLKNIIVEIEKTKKSLNSLKLDGFNKNRAFNEFNDFKSIIEVQIMAIDNQNKN